LFGKLSAIAIIAILLSVSIAIVSFNTSAEDVPGPFTDRSAGYPHATVNLDAQQGGYNNAVYPTSSFTAGQIFKATQDGILDHLETCIGVNAGSPGDSFNIKIWNTDQVGTPTNVIGALYLHYGDLSTVTGWYSFNFLSQHIKMQNGMEYALSVDVTSGITLEWRYSSSNPYSNGYSIRSYDHGTTWAVWDANYDFTFKFYVQTGTPGLKKVA